MVVDNLSKIELEMLVIDCVDTVFKNRCIGAKGIKVLLNESEAFEILGGEHLVLHEQLTRYRIGETTLFEKQEVLQLAAQSA
ncbi:hypothetical protein [Haliscomenobacter sp.]|uniref:hypothetical protein n=1 Tax=Haliscomenobacter sp. TaxID=2717303 RepID=UPI003BAC78F4